MKKLNQKGFGLVEGLLILIVVLLVGFIGYYVWHTQNDADKTSDQAVKSSQSQSSSSKTAPGKTAQKYLTIKEWGVKLPLATDDSSAYYVYTAPTAQSLGSGVSIYDKSIDATSNSKGTSCKDDGYPLFVIDRVKSSDVARTSNPDGQYFIEETNIDMYKTFSFTKDYQFIGRTIHQSAPPCEEFSSDGTTTTGTIDDLYGKVWVALGKSYDGIQAE